jgi:hypothetical protein
MLETRLTPGGSARPPRPPGVRFAPHGAGPAVASRRPAPGVAGSPWGARALRPLGASTARARACDKDALARSVQHAASGLPARAFAVPPFGARKARPLRARPTRRKNNSNSKNPGRRAPSPRTPLPHLPRLRAKTKATATTFFLSGRFAPSALRARLQVTTSSSFSAAAERETAPTPAPRRARARPLNRCVEGKGAWGKPQATSGRFSPH